MKLYENASISVEISAQARLVGVNAIALIKVQIKRKAFQFASEIRKIAQATQDEAL